MKHILFITHGSKNIGMGHVMRCVSLANAFRNKNWQVTFFSKYQLGREYIEKQQFALLATPTEPEKRNTNFEYGNVEELEQEWTGLEQMLIKHNPDVIFVDSYNVSNAYFQKLRKYTKCLVYLDDIAAFSYDVDVVLNYNCSAFQMGYEELLKETKLLLGVKYCPLRDEFLNVPKRITSTNVADILITTGAADPKNVTCQLISLCLKFVPQCKLHIVVGKAFIYKEDLYKVQDKNNNILLYENPPKMSEIMLKCDIAITAGGSTMYELAACGIPMLAFIYAENQRSMVEMLEQKGYLINLGECANVEQNFWKKSRELFEDDKLRRKMSRGLQTLVDGEGARRVEKAVRRLL